MTYQFITQHRQEFPVQRMCQVLDVSESGYSAWKHRKPSRRTLANGHLATRLCQAHEASHRMYGSRRIQAELLEQGVNLGIKRLWHAFGDGVMCDKIKNNRFFTFSSHGAFPNPDVHHFFACPTF